MCLPGTVETVREQIRSEDGPRLNRRAVILGGLGAAVGATFPARASAGRGPHKPDRKRLQDLTHVFTEGFPVFSFDPPAREDLVTIPTGGFYSQKWTFGEHSGTHMDAPGHFVSGGRLSPEITPEELIVPIAVIDVSARAARNPDTTLTADDVRRFERRHGRIPKGALVCMDSGWASKIDDPLEFKGGASYPDYHFPGFTSRPPCGSPSTTTSPASGSTRSASTPATRAPSPST